MSLISFYVLQSDFATSRKSNHMNTNQCEACKFQNKPCDKDCIFASLFPSDIPYKFEVVNTIFGLETLTFFLKDLPPRERKATAETFYFEANSCFVDPAKGGTDLVTALINHANQTPEELSETKKLLAHYSRLPVLALPAMCKKLEMVSSDDSQAEIFELPEKLEPSANGKASDDETKAE